MGSAEYALLGALTGKMPTGRLANHSYSLNHFAPSEVVVDDHIRISTAAVTTVLRIGSGLDLGMQAWSGRNPPATSKLRSTAKWPRQQRREINEADL